LEDPKWTDLKIETCVAQRHVNHHPNRSLRSNTTLYSYHLVNPELARGRRERDARLLRASRRTEMRAQVAGRRAPSACARSSRQLYCVTVADSCTSESAQFPLVRGPDVKFEDLGDENR
jgi:hypothetical protein